MYNKWNIAKDNKIKQDDNNALISTIICVLLSHNTRTYYNMQ